MTDDEDAYQAKVRVQRGTSTDDRDTIEMKVSADSIDELDAKVEQVEGKIEDWAQDLRAIQPKRPRETFDDQSTLEEVDGDE